MICTASTKVFSAVLLFTIRWPSYKLAEGRISSFFRCFDCRGKLFRLYSSYTPQENILAHYLKIHELKNTVKLVCYRKARLSRIETLNNLNPVNYPLGHLFNQPYTFSYLRTQRCAKKWKITSMCQQRVEPKMVAIIWVADLNKFFQLISNPQN